MLNRIRVYLKLRELKMKCKLTPNEGATLRQSTIKFLIKCMLRILPYLKLILYLKILS